MYKTIGHILYESCSKIPKDSTEIFMDFYLDRFDTNQFKTEIDRNFAEKCFYENIKMKVGI